MNTFCPAEPKLPERNTDIEPGPSNPFRLMVTGPSACLRSSGSWVLHPSHGTPACWVAPIMCTVLPAGAISSMPAGNFSFAASPNTKLSEPGETCLGGLNRSSFTAELNVEPFSTGPTSKCPSVARSDPPYSATFCTVAVCSAGSTLGTDAGLRRDCLASLT